MRTSTLRRFALLLVVAPAISAIAVGQGKQNLPDNLGAQLQALARLTSHVHDPDAAVLRGLPRVDSQMRVRVEVRLSGARSMEQVGEALEQAGVEVISRLAELPLGYSAESLAVRAPIASLGALARLPGVQAIVPLRARRSPRSSAEENELRPLLSAATPPVLPPILPLQPEGPPAGHAPSQAAGPLGVTVLNGKYTGAGVTIGVISDSYNLCAACKTTAAEDIASGNLPGGGNPYGDTTPVVVLSDNAGFDEQPSDEGRAMLQIIYGLAPKAKLCFTTSGATQTDMAAAVTSLASASGSCHANVIVDDVRFPDEPFFSDDIIAGAINQAQAAGAIYISAASEGDGSVFEGSFNPISDATARAGTYGNLKFSTVPEALTGGGFMNFAASGGPLLAFGITSSDASLVLQWDDPFIAGGITADFNLLVFDSQGNYISTASGIDNNFSTGEPLEYAAISGTGMQVVLSLGATATGSPAKHVRIIGQSGNAPYTVSGIPVENGAAVYGHNTAMGAIGASAFDYNNLSAPESFIDLGPFTDDFSSTGVRLASPQIRDTPVVAGVDGVDVTFGIGGATGGDTDGDGFENLYGTSASAATLAAVAGLTFEASGNKATATQVENWLIQSGSSASVWSDQAGYGYVNAQKATLLASGGTPGSASTTTTIASSKNPSPLGTAVTFTATVASSGGTPTGNVTFYDGLNGLGSAQLAANGTATFADSSLASGSHAITVRYAGDATRAGSVSAALSQSVTGTAVATTTTLKSSANPVMASLGFVLTATVTSTGSAPTGSVTFMEGSTNLGKVTLNGSGVATLHNFADYGTHAYTAQYSGDSTHAASKGTLSQVVTPIAPTLTLEVLDLYNTLIPYSSQAANPIGLTFVVTYNVSDDNYDPTPAPVTFYDGSTVLTTCMLSDEADFLPQGAQDMQSCGVNLPVLAVGNHTINAVLLSDGQASQGTVSAAITITPATLTPTFTLTSSLNPAPEGSAVTYTATVKGSGATPTGTVSLEINSTTVKTLSGGAPLTFTSPALPPGETDIIASYSGDNTYKGATVDLAQNIGFPTTDKITITSSKSPAAPGTTVTFTTNISPIPSGFGDVFLYDGTNLIGEFDDIQDNGQASFAISSLYPGTHKITAEYVDEDDSDLTLTSAALSQVITGTGATSTTTISSSVDPVVAFAPTNISVKVTSTAAVPTGTVTVFAGTNTVGQFQLDGTGAITPFAYQFSATTNLTAVYGGDSATLPSTSAVLQEKVSGPGPVTVSALGVPNPSIVGERVDISMEVSTEYEEQPVPTGTLTVYDGSQVIGTGTVGTDGTANISLPFATAGNHSITVKYSGDSFNAAGSATYTQTVHAGAIPTLTLKSSIASASLGSTVTLTGNLSSSQSLTGVVTFYDGTVGLGTVVPGSGGGAVTLSSNALAAGTHSITAYYSGDTLNEPVTSSAVSVTIAKLSTAVTVGASENPIPAAAALVLFANLSSVNSFTSTGTVTFLDGGKAIGTGTVDANGTASFSISTLAAGNHNITASYAGDSNFSAATSTALALTVSSTSGPVASVSPTSLSYASTTVGSTTAAQVVTIKNTGTTAITLSSETVTGTNPASFLKSSTTCTASLAVNASCTVLVEFKPTVAGALAASLSISDNAPGSPQIVSLSGTGTTAGLSLAVSPSSLSFSSTAVGSTSAAQTVTIHNTGSGAVTLSGNTFGGANAASFVKAATTCVSPLAAGASCTNSIEFVPTAAGAFSATLLVNSNASGSPAMVTLSGTATAAGSAVVTVTPSSLSFAATKVGATSAAQTITIKNNGTTAITLSGNTLSGTNAGSFTKSATTCVSPLAAGASCTNSIEFVPTAVGALTASLLVNTSAPGSPVTVPLIGTGVDPATIMVTADSNTYVFNTVQGVIYLELRPDAAPKNVANFLSYVNGGAYNMSFIHRLVPGFVFQGGGYILVNDQIDVIATNAAVVNEFKLSNVRGTLAMALNGSDINSATDQFFFNLVDNSASLDPQKYTVIAQVVDVVGYPAGSLSVMDTIGADDVPDPSPVAGAVFSQLPLINYVSGTAVEPSNFVTVNSITPAIASGPTLTVTASLTFASTAIGTTTAAQAVMIKNTGTSAITFSTASAISGPNAASFIKAGSTCPDPLPAGQSCTNSIEFDPTAPGALSATLTIYDNAAGGPHAVALSGTGAGAALGVSVSPTSLSFASTSVGATSAAQTVTIRNTGTSPLTLSGNTFSGSNASSFLKSATTCVSPLAAGASCTNSIEFRPAASGASSASLNVNTNAPGSPAIVSLSGTGTAVATITVSPATLSFASTAVGVTTAAQTVTLTNTGTTAITFAATSSISGANATSFIKSAGTCPNPLPGGQSCTNLIEFDPKSTGSLAATLTIFDNATGSPHLVALSGMGH